MSNHLTAEEIRDIGAALDGWELPVDFEMPTLEELENDLALANPGWKEILRPSIDQAGKPESRQAVDPRFKRIRGLAPLMAGAMLGAICIAGFEAATSSNQSVSARPVAAHAASALPGSRIIWTGRGPIYIRDLAGGTCGRPQGHQSC